MKNYLVFTIILTVLSPAACNKQKVTVYPEIKIAGEGNYYINDMKIVSGNRGPISIKGDKTKEQQFIYMTGTYKDTKGIRRCLVAKYAENGKPVWYKLFPEAYTGYDRPIVSDGISLQVCADPLLKEECVYVLARDHTGTNNVGGQIILLKYDNLGNLLFKHVIIDSFFVFDPALAMDNARNLYCYGFFSDGEKDQIHIYKTNASGDPVWSNTYLYPYPSDPCGYKGYPPQNIRFQMLYPDRLICGGLLDDKNDLFYMTFDSLGNAGDMVVCKTPEMEGSLVDIKIDANRSVYLVGNDCNYNNFMAMVYDNKNILRWRNVYNDSLSQYNGACAFAIDDLGAMYINGTKTDSLILVKYDSTGTELWRTAKAWPFTEGMHEGPTWDWILAPDYIRDRREYGPAPEINITVCKDEGIMLIRCNTNGLMKTSSLYKEKKHGPCRIGAVDGKWLAVNLNDYGASQARLLKYEEFQMFGINRWD